MNTQTLQDQANDLYFALRSDDADMEAVRYDLLTFTATLARLVKSGELNARQQATLLRIAVR